MRFRTLVAPAAALVAAAALMGACGDDGSKQELSSQTASSLRSTLDEVEQLVATRDCTGAAQEAAALRSEVEGLPESVDGDLRRALESSADRLESLVADQCTPASEAPVQAPTGTTSQDGVQQPEGDQDQADKPKKDKKPKPEKPNQDQTAPDTGGTGQEDPGLNQPDGGAVPPGQE